MELLSRSFLYVELLWYKVVSTNWDSWSCFRVQN